MHTSLKWLKFVFLLADNSAPTTEGGLVFDGIRVSMTANALNGSQRVVMDDVITDDECRELHRLSNVSVKKQSV